MDLIVGIHVKLKACIYAFVNIQRPIINVNRLEGKVNTSVYTFLHIFKVYDIVWNYHLLNHSINSIVEYLTSCKVLRVNKCLKLELMHFSNPLLKFLKPTLTQFV